MVFDLRLVTALCMLYKIRGQPNHAQETALLSVLVPARLTRQVRQFNLEFLKFPDLLQFSSIGLWNYLDELCFVIEVVCCIIIFLMKNNNAVINIIAISYNIKYSSCVKNSVLYLLHQFNI